MENYSFPPTLRSWTEVKALDTSKPDVWWKPWEFLRPFFESKGYYLFQPGGRGGEYCKPTANKASGVVTSPAKDSFGLYGDREGYKSMFRQNSVAFAARDSHDRDVVIKVVGKEGEDTCEYNILRFLNSEPLRSLPGNATVNVIEFLVYEDWYFAVMPCYDGCDWPPFANAAEALDFAQQVLSIVSFLHDHHVAHLDISHENIVMNHHGERPRHGGEPTDFRSTFPVRYLFLDFGFSVHSATRGPADGFLVDPLSHGRPHKAPETVRSKFDPYAADVYQTARLLYIWLYNIIPDTPELVPIFQDMTYFNPSRRISALEATRRVQDVVTEILEDPVRGKIMRRPRVVDWATYHMIPLRHWDWLWDAICLRQFAVARDLLVHYRHGLIQDFVTGLKGLLNIAFRSPVKKVT